MDSWQLHLPFDMNYDRARPGAQVLHVALARLMRQEITKSRCLHGITVLMDMSTFYDTIDLQTLAKAAQELHHFPFGWQCSSILDPRLSLQRKSFHSSSMSPVR